MKKLFIVSIASLLFNACAHEEVKAPPAPPAVPADEVHEVEAGVTKRARKGKVSKKIEGKLPKNKSFQKECLTGKLAGLEKAYEELWREISNRCKQDEASKKEFCESLNVQAAEYAYNLPWKFYEEGVSYLCTLKLSYLYTLEPIQQTNPTAN